MHIEVNKLCQNNRFCEAIDLAGNLSKDRLDNLERLGEHLIQRIPRGQERDVLLLKLIHKFVAMRAFTRALNLALELNNFDAMGNTMEEIDLKLEQLHADACYWEPPEPLRNGWAKSGQTQSSRPSKSNSG